VAVLAVKPVRYCSSCGIGYQLISISEEKQLFEAHVAGMSGMVCEEGNVNSIEAEAPTQVGEAVFV